MNRNTEGLRHKAKPTLGYPSRTKAVEALWEQGLDYRQIAARLGIKNANAASLLVKVRKRRGKVTYTFGTDANNPFRRAAIARGITQEQVVLRLLDAFAEEPTLIDNVLDDDGGVL